MRHTFSILGAGLLALSQQAAQAQDATAPAADAAAAPASAFTFTGGATVISDYRFRGISQTNKRFAIQGTGTVSHSSGFYASFWGSSIDDYVAGGSDAELDLIGGYKKTINGTTIDGGFLYYYYPGSGGGNSDFFEPYLNVSHTFGPVGVKVGGNFAWKQRALQYVDVRNGVFHDKGDGIYAYGELSGAIPHSGVTLTGHLGHSFERNYITFGTQYTDWSVTAAYAWKALTFSVGYVDTSGKRANYLVGTRNEAKAGVVAGVGVAF